MPNRVKLFAVVGVLIAVALMTPQAILFPSGDHDTLFTHRL